MIDWSALPPAVWELIRLGISLGLIFGFLVVSVLLLIYMERKVAAFMQDRLGPYHTGKWGLLQSVADALKLLVKEDFQPASVDPFLFFAAPAMFFGTVAAATVVIPFDKDLVAANLNVGLVYVIAMGTLGFLGVIMAGWSSNNKYSLIGCFRACAQMVSYEIPMLLAVVTPVMLAGSLSLTEIVQAQTPIWFVLVLPVGFLTYFICALAETNRNPFDLPEAESELVAGFLTEYSGIRWAMFFLGEYGNMIIVSSIATTLFLGGWQGPFLPGVVWFLIKIYFLLFVFMWIRSTLPRLRADQLMEFAWKILIPVALVNIAVVGVVVVLLPDVYLIPLAVVNWLWLFGMILLGPRALQRTLRLNAEEIRQRTRLRESGGKPVAPPELVKVPSQATANRVGR